MAGPGEASAADWWFVRAEQEQDRSAALYVEKSSMLRASGTGLVTTLVWIIHRYDQNAGFGSYRSGKIRLTVDCERQEYGSASGRYYSAFGSQVHQYRQPAATMAPIPAKSLEEVAAVFMCSDGKRPLRSLPVYDPTRDAEQRFLEYDRDQPARARADEKDSESSSRR